MGKRSESEDVFHFLQPQKTVLDLGCGRGKYVSYIASRGLKVVGVDISADHLRKAPAVFQKVQADACRLPFRANSFDSVLCFEVLEHLNNPESCLSEVHRILNDDGVALFVCPCLNIPCKALIPIYRKLAGIKPEVAKEHLHVFNQQYLKKMLSHYFEIIAIKYTRFLTIIENRLGIGYSLEPMLSSLATKVPPLHYFAAAVWIKVRKAN